MARDGRRRSNDQGRVVSPDSAKLKGRPPERNRSTSRRGDDHRRSGQNLKRDNRSGDGRTKTSSVDSVHLSDEIVRELKSTARPGKGEILVKVFAEAAGAFAADMIDEAIRLGEQAKHIALRSATVRELLGLAYYRAGRWKEAARELSAFRRISGSTDQNPVIADSFRAQQRPERALELVDEIDPLSVDPAVAYEGAIVAAGALADMKRLEEAIDRLQALDLRPSVPQEHHLRAWYVLGDLLERRGRFTQAREWFEAVVSTNAELTDAPERLQRLPAR